MGSISAPRGMPIFVHKFCWKISQTKFTSGSREGMSDQDG
jgi:hypothetical protein